jgi:hypothetical protein
MQPEGLRKLKRIHLIRSRTRDFAACSIVPYPLCYLMLLALIGGIRNTVPTKRPPIVGEVSANFCGQKVPCGEHDGSLQQALS